MFRVPAQVVKSLVTLHRDFDSSARPSHASNPPRQPFMPITLHLQVVKALVTLFHAIDPAVRALHAATHRANPWKPSTSCWTCCLRRW
jgi:hypothetical protein